MSEAQNDQDRGRTKELSGTQEIAAEQKNFQGRRRLRQNKRTFRDAGDCGRTIRNVTEQQNDRKCDSTAERPEM